jgi:hypothetical protein
MLSVSAITHSTASREEEVPSSKWRNALRCSCVLIVLASLLPNRCYAKDDACSKARLHQVAVDVGTAQRALLALPAAEDDWEPQIPRPASEAIERMKDTLGELVRAYMSCVPNSAPPNPLQIREDLSDVIEGAGGVVDPDSSGRYGSELYFEARVTQDRRRLISITATFHIKCGSDTVLLVFAPSGGRWEEVLRWQSPPYQRVFGAFGSFQYGISPADRAGSWYVVTAYIPGSCASTWSSIRYDVLRPAATSSTPKVLLAKLDTIWWGDGDEGKLAVNQKDFDLRFHGESIDKGVFVRVFIRHYAVNGDVVRRIQPVAASPRDFVDEWIVSPWPEAANWSTERNVKKLRLAHEELQRINSKQDTLFSYSSVRECAGSPDTVQVELCPGNGPSFYFHVSGNKSFMMMSISKEPDSACAGKDMPGSMSTQ